MSDLSHKITWQHAPQRTELRMDWGCRISITPYRRSPPHLIVSLSGLLLRQLGWSVGDTLGMQLLFPAPGAPPIQARLLPRSGADGGRMVHRHGGRGRTGSGVVSFLMPACAMTARAKSHEPNFRADTRRDGAWLTIDLPKLGEVP